MTTEQGLEQRVADLNGQRWTDRNGPIVVIALALMGGLVGIFNRSLSFHDEIINTQKAASTMVVDYAMRPAFYGMNVVALKVFGDHSYALVILSVISLVITALCLYYICARYFSASIGLLCVVALVGMNMVREYGIRGMAHLHAGMFMMLSLYCALACFSEEIAPRQRLLAFAAGLLAIVSFSTHPTMAGYLVALCTFAALTWFLSLTRSTASSALACRIRPALWMAFGVAAGLVALVGIYAIWYSQGYFSAWLRFAKIPQGSEAEREIGLFYIRSLIRNGDLPLKLLLASIAVLAVRRFRGGSAAPPSSSSKQRAFVLALPLYCLVVGAAMVSLNQWRHERLLVSYLPLIVLSFACWAAAAKEAIADMLPPQWVRLIVILVGVSVTVRASGELIQGAGVDQAHSQDQRYKYLALYEALRNVPDPNVGVLVEGKLGTKASFAYAAGLVPVGVGSPQELAALADIESFEGHLKSKKIRYLYWDLESTTAEEHQEIAERLQKIGGGLILNWRGLRELWFIRFPTDDFSESLCHQQPGTRVGVFGEAIELSPETDFSMRVVLENCQMRPYILNVNKRSAPRQLYYLTRNKADYVLLPMRASNSVTQAEIVAMQETLTEVGASKIDEGGDPLLQLWHIPDRERAAARAEN